MKANTRLAKKLFILALKILLLILIAALVRVIFIGVRTEIDYHRAIKQLQRLPLDDKARNNP